MATIQIDSSDLKRLMRELDRVQAKLPQAIARGLNESGDKVRTQVRSAMRAQTGLRLKSVKRRQRTVRAHAGSLRYSIVFSGKPPTKPDEFRTRVKAGKGGGVTIWLWGVAHKFARSFKQKERGGLRARLGGPRFPVRGFDGPNLAKEAVKDQTAEAFHRTTAAVVAPIVEKHLMKLMR